MGSTLDVARLVHSDGERAVDGLYLGLMTDYAGRECHCLLMPGHDRGPHIVVADEYWPGLLGVMLPTKEWFTSVG